MFKRIYVNIFFGICCVAVTMIICLVGCAVTHTDIRWWALVYIILLFFALKTYSLVSNKLHKNILNHHTKFDEDYLGHFRN